MIFAQTINISEYPTRSIVNPPFNKQMKAYIVYIIPLLPYHYETHLSDNDPLKTTFTELQLLE